MDSLRSYIICTSPRSGSTLLCKLLSGTSRAGLPESYFHDSSLAEWLSYYGLCGEQYASERDALVAVFSAAYDHGSSQTGIFGLRLQRHSFDFFMQKLEILHPSSTNDKSRLQDAFGDTLFIHLTRENKLDQAISYVKASQTGLWHIAPDGAELERLSEPKEPVYDERAIANQLSLSKMMDEEWEAWFCDASIEPLRVTYDQLTSNPKDVLARIFENLGVECEYRDDAKLPVAKLTNATNKNGSNGSRQKTKVFDALKSKGGFVPHCGRSDAGFRGGAREGPLFSLHCKYCSGVLSMIKVPSFPSNHGIRRSGLSAKQTLVRIAAKVCFEPKMP